MDRREELIYPEYGHIGVLDGIRAISVFIVSLFHFWQQSWLQGYIKFNPFASLGIGAFTPDGVIRYGFIFVDMMILLSGFLLYLPVAKNTSPFFDIRLYFRKRVARILPSYYFSIIVMLIFFVRPSMYANTGLFLKDLFAHLSFTQSFWTDTMLGTKYLTVSWTLAIEMQFYILFPLIAKLFKKYPLPLFSVMTVLSAAYIYLVPYSHPDTARMTINQLPAYLAVYALGMLGAEIFLRLSARLKRRTAVYITAASGFLISLILFALLLEKGMAASHWIEDMQLRQVLCRIPLSLVFLLMILSLCFSAPFVRFIFSCKFMRFGAAISYNYYLWHQFISVKLKHWHIPYYPDAVTGSNTWPQSASSELWHKDWQIKYSIIIVTVSIVFAALTTYLIEKPCAMLIMKKRK